MAKLKLLIDKSLESPETLLTSIKLNPSWKTEVSKSAWIMPCKLNYNQSIWQSNSNTWVKMMQREPSSKMHHFSVFLQKIKLSNTYNGKKAWLNFMLLILLSCWDISSVVSGKFVTRVRILLNKVHTSFFTFFILDFPSHRVNFTN